MTDITLYNTRSRTVETLEPIDPENIRLYVCGPTVYDRAHVGNARPVVVFDILFRLLREVYGAERVTYVRNLTDVDDKINARAKESGVSIDTITAETIGWYHDDMDAIGAMRPTHEPRATDHINGMIAIIEELVKKGNAYADDAGHVLFAVNSYDQYGTLGRRSLSEMRAGSRVEIADNKRDAMDFVLWKPSTDDQPGWDSPWGRGRPGWHIECSAMSRELLGPVFDIHGGGVDLVFPHHENEVAQSCCANGTDRMANFFVHNGFVQVEGEKMSKSLGNFFTVRDLLDLDIPGEVIRYVLMATHYRAPLDWSRAKAREAETVLRKWRKLTRDATPGHIDPRVLAAVANDLNVPQAIAVLHELANAEDGAALLASARFLGLLTPEIGAWAEAATADGKATAVIEALLAERKQAKADKDFARADAIRDQLTKAGVTVTDGPDGARFELSPAFDISKLDAETQ